MNFILYGQDMSVIKHTFRIMKITLISLFACICTLFATEANSQNAKVSIQANGFTIQKVINEIEKQTDFLFVYDKNEVNVNRKVSINVNEESVSEVLNKIFENTNVAYRVLGKNITLIVRPESASKPVIQSQQKQKRITGTVVDAKGEPIIGANVVEKGTTNGIITDVDGKFSLNVSDNSVIQISYIGYLSQDIAIKNQKEINIRLLEDTQSLEEIVVVGYGTQKKGDVSSAISSIKSEKFLKLPTTDAAQLIRGQVAGLSVVTADANPTSSSQISLRGITTLKSSTSPLVLIDGIPGDMNMVSPDDIQQIDVLKDGSAAAIYGTRGTNGVILITTKNATGEMPTEVDVNAYLSTQQITKRLPFMNASEYRQLVKEGKPGAVDGGADINWLDEVTRTPLTQIYNVSLRGGSRTTNYVASFEYRGLNGLIKRSNNNKFYPRIEITHRMFDSKLKINASLSGYKQSYFSGSDGGSYNSGVYRNALTYNPTTPIKDANGNWSESPSKTDYFNPVALLEEVDGQNLATNLRMFSTVTFTPIKGLDIKYLISSDTYNQTRGYYETHQNITTVRESKNGYASRGTTRSTEDLSELTASYNKTIFDDHTFTILAGYSWLKDNYQNYYMQNFNFPSDSYSYNNMGAGQALADGRATEYSYQSENKLIGYFGRFNYSYKGKYMLAASVRHEGSTKFGTNHKWGTFPSVSGAWNIKAEKFLQDVKVLSILKLRAGYGVTGTEPSDPYMSLNTLSFGTYDYYNGSYIKTIRPASNANPDLKWERKKETNIGVDFGFLNDRITGNIDYYNRVTKDLIWDYSVPSPPYLYSSMTANAGSMRNRGIEAALTVIPVQTKDWQWSSSFNYSHNNNKLLSLSNEKFISNGYSDQGSTGEPIQTTTHRIQEGYSIGNFYGYKSIDIDDNGHWIIEGQDGNAKPISEEQPTDKKILGNGLPKHYLNWNNTINYKHFDCTITMRGAFSFDILNMAKLQYGAPVMLSRGNIFRSAYDNVYGKRALADDQELQYVSYYIEKGDYWKIDNFTLGYTAKLRTPWIKNLRVYGTISNLATITGYSGIDPEVSISGLAPGCDDKNRYPSTRTFTFGLSVKF